MATPLDFFSVLKQTEPVFQFLLIVTIMYITLEKFVPGVKGKKTAAGVLAFTIGVLTMFSPIAARTISLAMPGFVLLMIFLIFVLIVFYSMGHGEKEVMGVLNSKKYDYLNIIILFIAVGIVLGSLGKAFAESGGIGVGDTSGQEAEFYKTVFHPKILGMTFVLLLGFFTIQRLNNNPVKESKGK